jgi:hypothetical protein
VTAPPRDRIDELIERGFREANAPRPDVGGLLARLIAGACRPEHVARQERLRRLLHDDPDRIVEIAYHDTFVTLVARDGVAETLRLDAPAMPAAIKLLSARCPRAALIHGAPRSRGDLPVARVARRK